jgi:hypothetical protein
VTTADLNPQYRWLDGHFQELTQTIDNVLYMLLKDTYVVVWNDFNQKYDWGISNGRHIERVWDFDHLPAEFRVHLLLLGVR